MTRLIFPLLLAAALPAYGADLTIDVAGVSGTDGRIMVAVYDSAEAFPAKPLRGVDVPAQHGAVQVRVTGLPAGDYALAVYHDANGNGKLDRNPLGMPTEDYAFSNNAIGKRGAPSFNDARVALPADGASTSVKLR